MTMEEKKPEEHLGSKDGLPGNGLRQNTTEDRHIANNGVRESRPDGRGGESRLKKEAPARFRPSHGEADFGGCRIQFRAINPGRKEKKMPYL